MQENFDDSLLDVNKNSNHTVKDFDKPLTEEEKEDLIKRHYALVDKLNAKLPDGMKLNYDENLEKRLNDPKEIRIYRKLQYISNRYEEQNRIFNELEKNAIADTSKQYLRRSFQFGLKTDGTPESQKYNEDYYKAYKENPEQVFYLRYKNVITSDFGEINKIKRDNVEGMLDLYIDHPEVIEDAFVFKSALEDNFNDLKLTPEFLKMANMAGLAEQIADPKNIVERSGTFEYFTLPKLSFEQAAILSADKEISFGVGKMTENINPENKRLNSICNATLQDSINKDYLEALNKKNVPIDKDTFLSIKGYNKETKDDIGIGDALFGNNPNYVIRHRTGYDKFHAANITQGYESALLNENNRILLDRYNKEENVRNLDTFSVDTLKDRTKGGFWERFRGTTSQYFKDFRTALEEYNNPASKNYLNNKNLMDKAQGYIDYKNNQKRPASFNNTEKQRIALCEACVKATTYSNMNLDKVRKIAENNYLAPYNTIMKEHIKEPAFENPEIDLDESIDNSLENVKSKDLDLEESFDSSKDDLSMDAK